MIRTIEISPAQISDYSRDGAVLLKAVLNSEELQLLTQGLQDAYAEPDQRSSVVRAHDGSGETRIATFPSTSSPALGKLMESGVVGQIAGRIMQVPSAQLVHEQSFYKSPGRIVPTPWHQDTPFLCVRGMDMCRVWLSCDPSPADITVQLVRGSHLWNIVYSMDAGGKVMLDQTDQRPEYSYDHFAEPDLPRVPDVGSHLDSFDILRFEVEPGDALVFQGNMVHGAEGRDFHPVARRAFATMWGGPDLKYHQQRGKAFPPPRGEGAQPIPHGAKIGEHDDAFPVGWQA